MPLSETYTGNQVFFMTNLWRRSACGVLVTTCLLSQAKPVNERLRELGGTAKLALDILEFDDKLERAFNFICGCTPPRASAQRRSFRGPTVAMVDMLVTHTKPHRQIQESQPCTYGSSTQQQHTCQGLHATCRTSRYSLLLWPYPGRRSCNIDAYGAARSALVCDGVSEAKRLAYMGPERHKVVAQDGTLIAKSGCITGGLTGNEAERAQRFDEQRANALKEVRDEVFEYCIAAVFMPVLMAKVSARSARPYPRETLSSMVDAPIAVCCK